MTNDFKPSDFYHAEYAIGCGGTETPINWGGKSYLYVWNRKAKRHEYYVRPDDMFIPDTDAPWLDDPFAYDAGLGEGPVSAIMDSTKFKHENV